MAIPAVRHYTDPFEKVWMRFPVRGDERGSLIALEQLLSVPFDIKRVYYIFGTNAGVIRGKHAHRDLEQVAICVSGSCRFTLDNGFCRQDFILDRPNIGLHIGPMIWREMSDFTTDCVLLVLANKYYDELDYIRDYDQFLNLVRAS